MNKKNYVKPSIKVMMALYSEHLLDQASSSSIDGTTTKNGYDDSDEGTEVDGAAKEWGGDFWEDF